MVAYVQWRGSLCPDCGVQADLGRDPRTTFLLTDEICWGCRVQEDKRAAMQKEAGDKDLGSALHGVKIYIKGARPNKAKEVAADG